MCYSITVQQHQDRGPDGCFTRSHPSTTSVPSILRGDHATRSMLYRIVLWENLFFCYPQLQGVHSTAGRVIGHPPYAVNISAGHLHLQPALCVHCANGRIFLSRPSMARLRKPEAQNGCL